MFVFHSAQESGEPRATAAGWIERTLHTLKIAQKNGLRGTPRSPPLIALDLD
jgi:hypothetical protein